jgi:hypothetical protein
MLSPSRKSLTPHCAHSLLALAIGVVVTLAVCPSVQAQATQPAAAQAQNPAAPAPAAAQPPAPAAQPPSPAAKASAPAKPSAPRLNRSYKGLNIPADESIYTKERSQIQKWLRAGTIPAGEEQRFTNYYRNYALARWTFTDRLYDVAGFRRELAKELAMSYKPNRPNPAHDSLSLLVLSFMETCTDDKKLQSAGYNFSPVTRFNAIMMIGQLNQVEPSGTKLPTPLPAALPILMRRFQDPNQIDAVKLGALVGIRRHCLLEPRNANTVAKMMVDLLREKDSKRVRSPEGHAWMRLLAVQTFADLKGRPNTPGVATEFLSVIAETDSPDFLRYAAASGLGSLDYTNAGLDMNPLLQGLGLLAIEVCDSERQRMREEMESKKAPTPSGMGGYGEYAGGSGEDMESGMGGYEDMMGGSGYGYGGMAAGPTTSKEDRQIERIRRRLKDGLTAVLIGLGKKTKSTRQTASGVTAIAGTDEVKEQNIESLSDPIHEFFKVIDEKDRDTDKQIEAKPLDEAIADVRANLAEALSELGVEAPASPEFEPLPEPKPAGAYGTGGYGEMMPGEY